MDSKQNETRPFLRASPEPLVPEKELRGCIAILDANLLTSLRKPTRNGRDLGDLLDRLRSPEAGVRFVMLLPAIAETFYRTQTATPARILKKKDEWLAEHFAPYGIPEITLFQLDDSFGPDQGLFEIFYRVVANFWVLHLARKALTKFSSVEQRAAALTMFFDEVEAAGLGPTSKIHLVAAGSAICGNPQAQMALNLQCGTPADLMNGSWDLMQWYTLVQLYLKSDRTFLHPHLFTYDQGAAGLFTEIRPGPDGELLFTYGLDRVDERLRTLLRDRVAASVKCKLDSWTFIQTVRTKLPSSDCCPQYFQALKLFDACAVNNLAKVLSARK